MLLYHPSAPVVLASFWKYSVLCSSWVQSGDNPFLFRVGAKSFYPFRKLPSEMTQALPMDLSEVLSLPPPPAPQDFWGYLGWLPALSRRSLSALCFNVFSQRPAWSAYPISPLPPRFENNAYSHQELLLRFRDKKGALLHVT